MRRREFLSYTGWQAALCLCTPWSSSWEAACQKMSCDLTVTSREVAPSDGSHGGGRSPPLKNLRGRALSGCPRRGIFTSRASAEAGEMVCFVQSSILWLDNPARTLIKVTCSETHWVARWVGKSAVVASRSQCGVQGKEKTGWPVSPGLHGLCRLSHHNWPSRNPLITIDQMAS